MCKLREKSVKEQRFCRETEMSLNCGSETSYDSCVTLEKSLHPIGFKSSSVYRRESITIFTRVLWAQMKSEARVML